MGCHDITHQQSCNKLFEVALLRHPAVSVPAGTCYGRLDVPLAPGWESWAADRAAQLGARAYAMSAVCVWSSPSSRCASVAGVLARQLELPLILDGRLMELDFGEWEGRRWDDLPRPALDRWAADPSGFSPPGGESGVRLIERITAIGQMLAVKAQPCIVVSHGGPLRLLPALLRGEAGDLMAPSPDPGSLSIVKAGQS